MYCPPKLPFFIKKCCLKLHNLPYILIYIVPLNYRLVVLYGVFWRKWGQAFPNFEPLKNS